MAMYRKIDATFLPEGYQTNEKKGFYAEFYPDGQLKIYGFYPLTKWDKINLYLLLAHDKEEGKYIKSRGVEDSSAFWIEWHEDYEDGRSKFYHYINDGPTDEAQDWIEWVKAVINLIGKRGTEELSKGKEIGNSATKKEMIEIEKRINAELQLGMDSEKADQIIYLSDKLDEKMLRVDIDKKENGFHTIYHLRESYDIFLVSKQRSDGKFGRIISNFILIGEGWSEETRKKFAGHWNKDDPELYKMFGIE